MKLGERVSFCKRGHSRDNGQWKGKVCLLCKRERANAYQRTEKYKEYKNEYNRTPKRIKHFKEYYKSNKEKLYFTHIKNRYGLTKDGYNKILEQQNYSCAICKRHKSKLSKPLCVDHNHSTGKARGLLCYRCNGWIVTVVEHSKELIPVAQDYLKQYEVTK